VNPDHATDPPRDWWDTVTDLQPGDDWWEKVDRPQQPEAPDPRFHPRARPGETWHDRMLRKHAERVSGEEPRPGPRPSAGRPIAKLSKRARDVRAGIPCQSRKPGGKYREGQRSGSRKIAVPSFPVVPHLVVSVFQRRWRGKYLVTFPWRIRGLAVIAVAMSVPPGTTIEALVRMLPRDVLQLSMPLSAWRWVVHWLHQRRHAMGAKSDDQPWLTFRNSRGTPPQISWAATRTLDRAGLPGWRLSKLLRASWCFPPLSVPFGKAASGLPVWWDSPLRKMATG